MAKDQEIAEKLLSSWLQMSTIIRARRIVSQLSFNEMVICGILLREKNAHPDGLTATQLCNETRLLKSQINKLITGLQEKEYITCERSTTDKRKVLIQITRSGIKKYRSEHDDIMGLVTNITKDLGMRESQKLSTLLDKAMESAQKYIFTEKGDN